MSKDPTATDIRIEETHTRAHTHVPAVDLIYRHVGATHAKAKALLTKNVICFTLLE